MKMSAKWSLSTLWLLASMTALFVPIYIPSAQGAVPIFQNAIAMSTAVMYALAFPASLLGVPILYVTQALLGIDPNAIGGKYVNLFIVFLLGVIQWFFIVPRLLRTRHEDSRIGELQGATNAQLRSGDAGINIPTDLFDSDLKTPLDRVFSENDRK